MSSRYLGKRQNRSYGQNERCCRRDPHTNLSQEAIILSHALCSFSASLTIEKTLKFHIFRLACGRLTSTHLLKQAKGKQVN